MSRVRDLNPGFFLDDELADLTPLHRLLFAGLWCIADREGRLADRPRKIKPQVLPYDDCDVDEMLTDLHDSGFIFRYGATGRPAIAIPAWSRYQRPHYKEADSILEPPSGQRWAELEATSGQAWRAVDNSSRPTSHAVPVPVPGTDRRTSSKVKTCPKDGAELVHDGDGTENRHCPICSPVAVAS